MRLKICLIAVLLGSVTVGCRHHHLRAGTLSDVQTAEQSRDHMKIRTSRN